MTALPIGGKVLPFTFWRMRIAWSGGHVGVVLFR
jgi:hypothetical protein